MSSRCKTKRLDEKLNKIIDSLYFKAILCYLIIKSPNNGLTLLAIANLCLGYPLKLVCLHYIVKLCLS